MEQLDRLANGGGRRHDNDPPPEVVQFSLQANQAPNTGTIDEVHVCGIDHDASGVFLDRGPARFQEQLDGPRVQHPLGSDPRIRDLAPHDLRHGHEELLCGGRRQLMSLDPPQRWRARVWRCSHAVDESMVSDGQPIPIVEQARLPVPEGLVIDPDAVPAAQIYHDVALRLALEAGVLA
jgi:hypothetical protein